MIPRRKLWIVFTGMKGLGFVPSLPPKSMDIKSRSKSETFVINWAVGDMCVILKHISEKVFFL